MSLSTFLRFDGRLWENLHFQKYPGWETDRIAHRPPTGQSDYRLALLDQRGAVLVEEHPLVDFNEGCRSQGPIRSSRVTAYLPAHAEGRELLFMRRDHEIWRSPVAEHPPSLSIIEVASKEPERYLLSWTAEVHASQHLTFRVFYFVDKQHAFLLTSELTETKFVADISHLPGGADCQFGVLATDGLRSRLKLTVPMAVSPRRPHVILHYPGPGAVLPHSMPGGAAGSSFDAFGRELPKEGLLWMLDDQVLARSVRQVELPRIEPGRHRLTLRYQGDAGATDENHVEFSVADPTPFEREWMRLRDKTIAQMQGRE